jgi:penicillin-binding protein 1A
VTGGGVPAGIWHDYMAQALPRLQSVPIPGSELPTPQPQVVQDPIGDVLSGAVPMNPPPQPSYTAPSDNLPPY